MGNAVESRHHRPLRVLVIDSYVPLYDREEGSNRLFKILKILRARGDSVAFLPDNFAAIEPYSDALRSLGVELLVAYPGSGSLASTLERALARVDVAWICRPELCRKYAQSVRGANVKVVYDTIDLHFMRERSRAEIEGLDDGRWQMRQALELDMARLADAVVTVTEGERSVLHDLAFAEAIVRLYRDRDAWERIASGSRAVLKSVGSEAVSTSLLSLLDRMRSL